MCVIHDYIQIINSRKWEYLELKGESLHNELMIAGNLGCVVFPFPPFQVLLYPTLGQEVSM